MDQLRIFVIVLNSTSGVFVFPLKSVLLDQKSVIKGQQVGESKGIIFIGR